MTEKETHPPIELESIGSEQLRRLLEIGTMLSSTLHLDELLRLVMEVATELTNTETASILLVDEKTGNLHFVASMASALPEDLIVPLDSSIAGWVVRNQQSLVLGNVQNDSRFYATVDKDLQFVTESMLAVPLIANGESLGALEVINKIGESDYSGQDVALLESLASQAAVAIMNARLFNQSDLLAEIMHELKTPMMAIRSASELLAHPKLPAEKKESLVYMIQNESVRLSHMTKDFLDFARLESGRVQLAREDVDVAMLIHEVILIGQSQAEQRGIEMHRELPEFLPVITGDYDRLKQVLLNLVSNAVKYNRENGRITLSVTVYDEMLHLGVTDTGQGISPQDLEHLFERFYRIPNSEKKSEGTGLGLSIAQKIAKAHGGEILVDSIIDEGTTFTIVLPRES